MSEKNRRKKDGSDKNKERQGMREGEEFQDRKAHEERQSADDQPDIIKYKSGSPGDRTRRGAT